MIDIPAVLAWLVVVVAMPLNWLTAVLQWRLSNVAPAIRVLRERAVAATALAIIVSVFALIFVNNDLGMPMLDLAATKLLTRGTMLALSVIPAVYWLRLWWRAK